MTVMAKMNPPNSDAVVEVREQDVDRFAKAGWTKTGSDEKRSSPARKAK